MSQEAATRQHLVEALKIRGTQARLAEALEVSAATVKRWGDGEPIPAAMVKLLRLYFFGEIPFDLVHAKQDLSSILRFTPEEWRMIEILARREGVEARDWIKAQVLAYLRFLDARDELAKQAEKYGSGLSIVPSPQDEASADESRVFYIDRRGGIAAGSPIDAVNWEPIPVRREYPEDHYALKVFGQSMEPKIPDGSIIVVREVPDNTFPKQGTIVVYSDASGSTLKVLGYRPAKSGEEANVFGKVPTLKSLNPAFREVQTMEGGRIDAVFVDILETTKD